MFDFSTRISGDPVRMVLPEMGPRTDAQTIARRLWRGSGFIALGGLLMVALAVLVLGLIPPTYTSNIQVLVDPTDLRVVENDVNARAPQADSGVSIAESQVRVIQSDNVLRRVVEKLHLDRDEEFVRPETSNPVLYWLRGVVMGMLPPHVSRDPVNIALDTLQRNIIVRRPERTFVIDVAVQSRDPAKAALIANSIGDAYFAEETAARMESAKRASDALAGRLASLKRDGMEQLRTMAKSFGLNDEAANTLLSGLIERAVTMVKPAEPAVEAFRATLRTPVPSSSCTRSKRV